MDTNVADLPGACPSVPDFRFDCEWLAVNLRTLKHWIECGDVRTLRFCLQDPGFLRRASIHGDMHVHEQIDAARAWLVEAEKFEEANGLGSKLNLQHSWNRNERLKILRFVERCSS